MTFLVLVVIVVVLAIVLKALGRGLKTARGPVAPLGTLLDRGAPVIGVVLVVAAVACSSFHAVDAGHVGVVYTFGAITNQTGAGLVATLPWQDLVPASVQIQKYVDKDIQAASKETQNVYASVTVNFQVSPVAIQKLYSNVGTNYQDVLIPSRVTNFFKEDVATYNSTDVIPSREEIRTRVRDKLKAELGPYSITVNDLLIDNIHFDPDFTKAIETKQVNTQNAQAEQNKVQVSEAQVRQKAAEAQGNADKLRIEAEGQAAANRAVSSSLTPELIQFQAVQKLAPNVQIALVPSGQGVILDPATLLKPAATPAGR